MGHDGSDAFTEIKKRGGRTIAESEDSAVVYGMPAELVEKGRRKLGLGRGKNRRAAFNLGRHGKGKTMALVKAESNCKQPGPVPAEAAELRGARGRTWRTPRCGSPHDTPHARHRSLPDAAAKLVSRLKREQDAAVREAILNTLVRLNDPNGYQRAGRLPSQRRCGPAQ